MDKPTIIANAAIVQHRMAMPLQTWSRQPELASASRSERKDSATLSPHSGQRPWVESVRRL
jgi:hypothetical protein